MAKTLAVVPDVTPGDVTPDIARANRVAIEAALFSGGTVMLPKGVVILDSTLTLLPQHSGGTLEGAGMRATVLRTLTGRTLDLTGDGIGYSEGVEQVHEDGSVTLMDHRPGTPHPSEVGRFQPGQACWGFRWNSFFEGQPADRTRHTIRHADYGARRLWFDELADPAHNCYQWCAGWAVEDANEGDDFVTVGPLAADYYYPGPLVAVCAGPAIANSPRSEFRRVTHTHQGRIYLDRPLDTGFTGAALVRVRMVEGVTITDLTIAQPSMLAANPFQAWLCHGLTLERVGLGVPGEATNSFAFIGSGGIELRDCDGDAHLGLNTTHDLAIRGGHVGSVYAEEGCGRIGLRGVFVGGNPALNVTGVAAVAGSERFTVEDCRLHNFGQNAGGGHGYPLLLLGRGHTVRRVNVSGSFPTACRIAADAVVEDLISDVRVLRE